MANNVATLNGIGITSIEAVNGITDDNLQALNGEEFAGYGGITWSTDDAAPTTGSTIKMGIVGAQTILGSDSGGKATYEHNGSSWSTTGSCSASHGAGVGGGTQNAGVIFGGWTGSDDSNATEEYGGTSWSTGNNMVQSSAYMCGGGTVQTAQLCTGGSQYNPTVRDLPMTQTYDGTNWANEGVNSSGHGSGGAGESGGGGLDAWLLTNGALDSPGVQSSCQLFDQSAGTWTSKAATNTKVRYFGSSTDGTRVYKIGGYDAPGFTETAVVESWVENTWTVENSLPAARRMGGWGSGGSEAAGGASNIAGAGSSGAVNTYYTAAAS